MCTYYFIATHLISKNEYGLHLECVEIEKTNLWEQKYNSENNDAPSGIFPPHCEITMVKKADRNS